MKNIFRKIWRDKRGTALIVAFLVMGVFMAVSLALSTLIFRELRITREAIDAGKAYYAAESGVEEALYYLNTSLPGWEDEKKDVSVGGAEFDYAVKNTCSSYPCADEDEYDVDFTDTSPDYLFGLYAPLDLNESITIPMFVVDEGGDVEAVTDFTVEFFAAFDPWNHLRVPNVSGWDVLRWKLFGMRQNGAGEFMTESINDFTAISSGKNVITGENFTTNSQYPSWFGTVSCSDSGVDQDQRPDIQCLDYSMTDQWARSLNGALCSNLEARDYYQYTEDGELYAVQPCYSIGQFLGEHQPEVNGAKGLNYLSLTNMMNPAMFKDQFSIVNEDDPGYLNNIVLNKKRKEELSRIYFRLEAYNDEKFVREYADIQADGYSNGVKQSISVQLKRGSFMPVFNFALYSTYQEDDSEFYE